MDHEEFIQSSAEYALGTLEGGDRKKFEAYLSNTTTDEQRLFSELIGTAAMIPLGMDKVTPPQSLKRRIMDQIALSAREGVTDRAAGVSRDLEKKTPNWIPWGIAASLGLVAVFSLFVFRLMGTIDEQNRNFVALEQDRNTLHTRLLALEDELARKNQQLAVLAGREAHVTIMNGLKINPVGYGKIIWDPESGSAILHVSNLPAIPTDRDYQLWVIKGKLPVSAGVFAVRDSAANFFKIDKLAVTNPKEIAAFAVTLEPKGGVALPTGAMYMMGSPVL